MPCSAPAAATWAGELPAVAPGAYLDVGRLFLEALRQATHTQAGSTGPVPAPGVRLRRAVLLGDARALHRDLSSARDALGMDDVEVIAPVVRVELPARAGGLPHPGSLLR